MRRRIYSFPKSSSPEQKIHNIQFDRQFIRNTYSIISIFISTLLFAGWVFQHLTRTGYIFVKAVTTCDWLFPGSKGAREQPDNVDMEEKEMTLPGSLLILGLLLLGLNLSQFCRNAALR